jgi:hypothetical protein
MTETIKSADGLAAASRVLACIGELRLVRVARAQCEGFRPYVEEEPTQLLTNIHISFQLDRENRYLGTMVKYEVSAANVKSDDSDDADGGEPDRLWAIDLEICADWELLEGAEPTVEDVQCFAIGQGLMTCHPYGRETVQSLSMRMGYPPAAMDLIRNPWMGGEVEITPMADNQQSIPEATE